MLLTTDPLHESVAQKLANRRLGCQADWKRIASIRLKELTISRDLVKAHEETMAAALKKKVLQLETDNQHVCPEIKALFVATSSPSGSLLAIWSTSEENTEDTRISYCSDAEMAIGGEEYKMRQLRVSQVDGPDEQDGYIEPLDEGGDDPREDPEDGFPKSLKR